MGKPWRKKILTTKGDSLTHEEPGSSNQGIALNRSWVIEYIILGINKSFHDGIELIFLMERVSGFLKITVK